MVKIEFRAMGSQMAAFIDDETPPSVHALEETPGWFEEWEQALSRFRPDSELNRLNESAGRAVKASPILWSVLRAALKAADWSSGLVVPTLLEALERAGYDRSFDHLLRSAGERSRIASNVYPAFQEMTEAHAWQGIRMDAGEHTVTLPEGVRLDLGGVAKGWAAQQALKRLKCFGPALVDASGDIATSGSRADGSPWAVAVMHPIKEDESLDMLAMKGGAAATSGIDYHRWLQNGAWKHHIIDPRSGEPAETDLMSATVTAPNVLQAEAAAKVVMILGSQAGLEWLEKRSELAGLLTLQDGRVICTSRLPDYVWS